MNASLTAGRRPEVTTCAIITSERPRVLTKRFELDRAGGLKRQTVAHVTAGHVEIREIATLTEFAELLERLEPNQALTYGLPFEAPARIVTQKTWAEQGRPAGCLPRTERTFTYRERPGVLCLDYDPPDGEALSRETLAEQLRAACPALRSAEFVWWPSAGSCIWHGDVELRGIRGHRLYVLVRDASDIPRAGKALIEHLWAAGFGYVKVSESGSLLERTLFDTTMWQASKLDFAAGAVCVPPIEQRRGHPVLIPAIEENGSEYLDTKTAIPDPSPEVLAAAKAAQVVARTAVREEAARKRREWLAARVQEIVTRIDPKGEDPKAAERAEALARRAVENSELRGDWTVQVVTADGNIEEATVLQLLDNPEHYHGLRTLDPLEPAYDGSRAVGKLFLFGARPCLHSMAHGGCTFKLFRQPDRIELVRGRERDATDAFMGRMRSAPDLFDYDEVLVAVQEGGTPCLESRLLALLCGWLGPVLALAQASERGFG